ncbi:hypothetical protein J4Q44_G00291800 [Coregonus suidteri]|uniref:Uncharacterized protein n=1 Tax=Coregonus suidteri TaxID=861788 RepID=A0AAN8KY88_9TELE
MPSFGFLILRWRHQNPNFLKLIQTRLEDPVEKEREKASFRRFFRRNSAQSITPHCRLWCGSSSPGWRSCFQHQPFNSPTPTLLQSHTNPSPVPHVEANALSSGDNHILASLSPSPLESFTDPDIQSEPIQAYGLPKKKQRGVRNGTAKIVETWC